MACPTKWVTYEEAGVGNIGSNASKLHHHGLIASCRLAEPNLSYSMLSNTTSNSNIDGWDVINELWMSACGMSNARKALYYMASM